MCSTHCVHIYRYDVEYKMFFAWQLVVELFQLTVGERVKILPAALSLFRGVANILPSVCSSSDLATAKILISSHATHAVLEVRSDVGSEL